MIKVFIINAIHFYSFEEGDVDAVRRGKTSTALRMESSKKLLHIFLKKRFKEIILDTI